MPGQGKAESCSGCSVLCPGLSSQALPRRPSPRCIPKASSGLCVLPGEALRRPGGRAVPLPTRREAKSAPGPSTRAQEASVNSSGLICRRRGCLPSGRPRRAGGGEGRRDAALELEGPPRGHLLRLRGGAGGGRPARDTRGTAATAPGVLTLPGWALAGWGRGTSSAHGRWRTGGCPRGPSSRARLSAVRDGAGAPGPRTPAPHFPGGRGSGSLTAPRPPPGKPGGTASSWARAAPGTLRGQGALTPGGAQDSPHLPGSGVFLLYEASSLLSFVSQTVPPSG